MAVERADVIDAIGTDKESGRVVLSVLDQLPFDEEREHLLLLQEKLNRYLVNPGTVYLFIKSN